MKSIRIIHADDHDLIRNGIKTMLANHAAHIKVIADIPSYRYLYACLKFYTPDVLLLDGVIEGGTIEDNLPIIRQQYPHMKILLFWMGANEESWNRYGQWLDGQLTIGKAEIDDIIQAIETVAAGEKYIPEYS